MKLSKAENWGHRLVRVLKERKIPFRRAARIAGVAPSVVDSWSSGASPNDMLAVKQLCDFLQISFTWLLTGVHEQSGLRPQVHEIFEERPFFEGIARIRIDRLFIKDEQNEK